MAEVNKIKNPLYQEDIHSIDNLKLDYNKFNHANVLISGGTGLIGTILVDMLNYINVKYDLNLTIYLITRNQTNARILFSHIETKLFFLEHDINKPLDINTKFDFIIHGASNTHPILYSQDPIHSLTTNIFGTYNLLQLATLNKNCRFVLISSVEIYGEDKLNLEKGFSEKDFGYLDCNTVRANYCEGKRASESLCQAFASQHNVDVVISRLCRCYGPGLRKDDSKALSQFINKAINSEDIVLKSEGNQYYSYLYASDAAAGIIFTLLKGSGGEAYNISDTSSNIKLFELAEILAHLSNIKVIFDIPDAIEAKGYSKATRAILNSDKIHALGWKPIYNIYEGLERTIRILKN